MRIQLDGFFQNCRAIVSVDYPELNVYVGVRAVHSGELSTSVEFGRENIDDGELFVAKAYQGHQRMAIAEKNFSEMSRRLLLVTPIGADRISVQNLSRSNTILVKSQQPLTPNQQRELALPVTMFAFNRQINISRATASRTMMQSLENLELPTQIPLGSSSGGLVSSFPLMDKMDIDNSDEFIDWLRAVIRVLRSAFSSIDFYTKATKELAELIGLDSTFVLEVDEDKQWKIIAEYDRMPLNSSKGDDVLESKLLDQILAEKRTFWETPKAKSLNAQTIEEYIASVAAPISDRDGEVIGALYGTRNVLPGSSVLGSISKLEAMLVETMAQGLSAGRMRVEQEHTAAEAQIRFEQFFTPELSKHLADSPELLNFRDAEVTLLFCDIRKFSQISEALGPAETMEWMSEVMSVMADIAAQYEGALVDYIGDELMFMWGAPTEQPDHASLACQATLKMATAVRELDEKWRPIIGHPTALGFGLNTGTAGVGNVGFERKFRYAPFGNTVNLASRVQGVTKFFEVDVIATDSTRSQYPLDCVSRRLCSVRVVNIKEPVMLHQLCVDESEEMKKLCQQYEKALSSFENNDMTSAIDSLTSILRDRPKDSPSLMLLSRAVDRLSNRDDNFDPVMEMPGK